MRKIIFLSCLLFPSIVIGQPKPTEDSKIIEAYQIKNQLTEDSRVKNVSFKNIGPTIMSGRVVALEVNPNDPDEFYVAYASGGVWHTINNGTSFNPISEEWPTQNIGEITMDWTNGTLWVGTGENNSSRSSYSGIGILKTNPDGSNWKNTGLHDSHHIGKILVNPNNSDHIVVGVTGHLYSNNKNRGVYVSNNGGKTWNQTLYLNERTGVIDMAYTPGNFDAMYATLWEKDRKAWNFDEDGTSSGIYKSLDGGITWNIITKEKSGFPRGEGVGRIGIAVFDKNIIYAVHDSQFFRKEKSNKKQSNELTKESFEDMSIKKFGKIKNNDLNKFLRSNRFPAEYTAKSVKSDIDKKRLKPSDLYKYLVDANSVMFETPIIGAEIYRSDNGGMSWYKTHTMHLDGVYNTYGYYFGKVHVDPNDSDKIYTYGVPILTSDDGGKTFYRIGKENVHADHHDLWINPNKRGHLINGNDGGVNITYDDGKNWIKNNSTEVGQFYSINVDYQKPYNVYGGLQDNGVWMGPHNSTENKRWEMSGSYPWEMILGGDGMEVQIDKNQPNIIYTGYQFGSYFRIDIDNNKRDFIKPRHKLGESPYRFNWQTPILLSSHNQDILYLGSNILHRSFNGGDKWENISSDLTMGGKQGNVPYGTITTISESEHKFGLIYVGTDDGLIHVTENGGSSWSRISDNLPQDLWVSKLYASSHDEATVFVSMNGYRWDDFTPYVYMSQDYGKSWTPINSNLPFSPVNVIIEDNVNKDILYVGNDHGVYISLNGGTFWEPFENGLNSASVHDLVIQKEMNHLLVGTHGRSIYLAELEKIQELTSAILNKQIYVYDIKDIKRSNNWGRKWGTWGDYVSPNIELVVFSKSKENYSLLITSSTGESVYTSQGIFDKGINYIDYDLKYGKHNMETSNDNSFYLDKGSYKLLVTINNSSIQKEFKIK
tara:strand:- start:874 stop:3687 length:2814 start_codon:yes stop_codon:yes gene_type:complete